MDPVAILRAHGGAARRELLVARGVTRRSLTAAVRDGRVVRPLYGCYAEPDAPRHAILRAAYRAELSCTSLCRALALPVMEHDARTHLWLPRDRARRADDRRPSANLVLHRSDHPDGEPVLVGLDLMGLCVARMVQIIALDAALHRRLISMRDIAGFVHTAPERRQWLLDRCDGRSESPIETMVRVACVEDGLRAEPQVPIEGAGRVDLIVEGRVAVETDGEGYHNNAQAWAEDQRKNRALMLRGLPPLRFTYADVVTDLPGVVRQIRAACA